MLVNVGMMYPFVEKSTFNYGIVSVSVAIELATCLFVVPTLICLAVVFILPYGTFGAMYMFVAPESTIPVLSDGKRFSFLFNT